MKEVALETRDCEFRAYSYVPAARTALVAGAVASLPLPRKLAARALGSALKAGSLPVGGFVVVQACGSRTNRPSVLTVQVAFEKGQGYRITGLVAATAARLIADGDVRHGVHYLFDAVNAARFLAELGRAGVTVAETGTGPFVKP
jgi:hypothetical protein